MIKRLKEKTIFTTAFFSIKNIDLKSSSGVATFQIIEKSDTALVVPILKNKILLIYEYFAAIDSYSLSFPKGRIEEGEDVRNTVNRELQEEIGYKAAAITHLATLTVSPGYLSQKTHIFLAEKLTISKKTVDELEQPEVREYTMEEIEKLIIKGVLTEARMIAAFHLLLQRRKVR
jgi:ADP-ribose diphosphatase